VRSTPFWHFVEVAADHASKGEAKNPRVRAFADFVASEIKSFRALLSNGRLTGT
jgi:hypothetical protein